MLAHAFIDYIIDIINIMAVTIFSVEHCFNDGFTYRHAGISYYTLLSHFLTHTHMHFGLQSARLFHKCNSYLGFLSNPQL